jgi:hypothetical protein
MTWGWFIIGFITFELTREENKRKEKKRASHLAVDKSLNPPASTSSTLGLTKHVGLVILEGNDKLRLK